MLRESARLMLEHAERRRHDSRFGDGDHGITVTRSLARERAHRGVGRRLHRANHRRSGHGRHGRARRGPRLATARSSAAWAPSSATTRTSFRRRRAPHVRRPPGRDAGYHHGAGGRQDHDGRPDPRRGGRRAGAAPTAPSTGHGRGRGRGGGRPASEGLLPSSAAREAWRSTIGTPDAGAVSTSLFLRGLANGARCCAQPGLPHRRAAGLLFPAIKRLRRSTMQMGSSSTTPTTHRGSCSRAWPWPTPTFRALLRP